MLEHHHLQFQSPEHLSVSQALVNFAEAISYPYINNDLGQNAGSGLHSPTLITAGYEIRSHKVTLEKPSTKKVNSYKETLKRPCFC